MIEPNYAPCTCTAPGAPPQKFLAEAEDSTSIRVAWAPPPDDKQHGDILYYKIYFEESDDPEALTKEVTISNPNTREYVLDQLRKWTNYKIWMLAGTMVGDGPHTEQIVIRTEEDGTSLHISIIDKKYITNIYFLSIYPHCHAIPALSLLPCFTLSHSSLYQLVNYSNSKSGESMLNSIRVFSVVSFSVIFSNMKMRMSFYYSNF